MKKFILILLSLPFLTFAQVLPKEETRYCGPPRRDEAGRIVRDSTVAYAFRKIHPCPATLLTNGACYGWSIDHVIPLACGGCDAVSNMQWLPNELKSAAGTLPKDRWERKVYANPESYESTSCKPAIVTK